MATFTVEFFNDVSLKAFNDPIFNNLYLAFAVAGTSFFMYTSLAKLLTQKDPSSDKGKLKPSELIRPFLYVLLIWIYPWILQGLDWGCGQLEAAFKPFEPSYQDFFSGYQIVFDAAAMQDMNTLEKIGYNVQVITNSLLHPELLFVEILKILTYLVDKLVLGYILCVRAVKLFMIKVFGTAAIVASQYHRFEGYAMNWLKIYVLNYSWIFAIFLINYFINLAIENNNLLSLTGNVVQAAKQQQVTLILMVMLFAKFILYFKSYQLLKEIFSNA